MAPTIITRRDLGPTLTAPLPNTSAMPANGPTALAFYRFISIEPFKSAAANISGMVEHHD